jgi:cyclopropane-fatty-acyl-phospholipid synthase
MSDNATTIAARQPHSGRSRLHRRFDEAILRICERLLGATSIGRLHLTLPSGANAWIDGPKPGVHAHLALRSYSAFWRSLRRGSIGFAESAIDGDLESHDLVALFAYFIDNRESLKRAGRNKFRVRRRDHAYHRSRTNTRAGSRSNISAHYDLGNEFYRLWLDPSLTYSSGFYATPNLSLEAAQQAKYDLIIDAAGLQTGHRVLEIGCGWGGFAVRAAAHGAQVTGLTLSREQLHEAQAVLDHLGHAARADIQLLDYRDAAGCYDRIVSIEMIEAVGEEHWPHYFSTIRDRLVPGGVAVLQAITIDERLYDTYRSKADFIQRYIFPGGMLATPALMEQHARASGLSFETVVTFGASYATTAAEWRRRFNEAWPSIRALGFDERFQRMWDYYLAYCEAGFERGTVNVGIYRLRKADVEIGPNTWPNPHLPEPVIGTQERATWQTT